LLGLWAYPSKQQYVSSHLFRLAAIQIDSVKRNDFFRSFHPSLLEIDLDFVLSIPSSATQLGTGGGKLKRNEGEGGRQGQGQIQGGQVEGCGQHVGDRCCPLK